MENLNGEAPRLTLMKSTLHLLLDRIPTPIGDLLVVADGEG